MAPSGQGGSREGGRTRTETHKPPGGVGGGGGGGTEPRGPEGRGEAPGDRATGPGRRDDRRRPAEADRPRAGGAGGDGAGRAAPRRGSRRPSRRTARETRPEDPRRAGSAGRGGGEAVVAGATGGGVGGRGRRTGQPPHPPRHPRRTLGPTSRDVAGRAGRGEGHTPEATPPPPGARRGGGALPPDASPFPQLPSPSRAARGWSPEGEAREPGGTRPSRVNDPSAGSPTETLLRLLLPLDSQVRPSSQRSARAVGRPRRGRSEGLTKPSNR